MFLFAQFGAEQPVPVKQQLGEQPVSELLQELETRKRGLAVVEFSFLPLGFSEVRPTCSDYAKLSSSVSASKKQRPEREEYIRPVLRHLVDKERELEPMKVTLQVSNKGIKIIQNVPRKNNKGKTEQIKHFIPHHAITCVMQESKPNDDVVCCILLIYNPLTKCPVHVHAYRCDSVETASTLRSQLQILIDRPENQKKFREIENRLAAKGFCHRGVSIRMVDLPGPMDLTELRILLEKEAHAIFLSWFPITSFRVSKKKEREVFKGLRQSHCLREVEAG
ncbi:PID domain-containing protein [Caerostris extrusa]|uniref:PID domain-containing protein n=1 Tax=Caerostris extrusa TaxID=172846 RepID=A0AAV4XDS1_CAEEX|nr:PID domain-containing protein [Caerostris extrusa]